MALASQFTYKPYAPPKTSALSSLLKPQPPTQDGYTQVSGSQGGSPNTQGLTYNQGRNGAPQLPPGEFGENSSAPLHVGQAPPGGFPQASSSSSSSSGGGGGGGGGGYDFNNDPILAQIRALNQRLIADAEASALAGRKKSEITFGFDPSMHYEDQATEQAARQNAFSTLAQLLAGHNQRAQSTDEGANKANLFYSSARAGAVRGEGKQYTLQQSLGNQDFQGKMQQIAQALMDVKNQAQEREIQGEEAAYERALAYGGGGGSGGGSGGGGGGGGGGGLDVVVPGGNAGGADVGAVRTAANAMAAARGWTHPDGSNELELKDQGQVHTDADGRPYVRVKFGTPGGNSTENVYLP